MKTAMLVCGHPRFCAEFDDQLAQLHTSGSLDLYCVFWTPDLSSPDERSKQSWINPRWQYDHAWAWEWISQKLPAGMNLRHLEFVNPRNMPPPPRNYQAFYCEALGLWRQFQLLQYANQRRRAIGGLYDLVIRSRPDVGTNSVDIDAIHQRLLGQPNTLIIPVPARGQPFNSSWSLGLEDTMLTMTNCIDYFDLAYLNGVLWNAEWLVSHILKSQGVAWESWGVESYLRKHGTLENGSFKPDWGRWI